MQIKKILFLAFVLTSNILLANLTPAENNAALKIYAGDACTIPPPANFHSIEVGATWIHLGWDAITPRVHRVRIFRVSDGFLLNTTDVAAGIGDVMIGGLPVATPIEAEIRTICTNGEEGPGVRFVPDGIILDLIVKSFAPEEGTESCTLKVGNPTCCFNVPGTTTFIARKVVPPLASRAFTIEKSLTQNLFTLKTDYNEEQSLWIQSDGNNPPHPNGSEYELKTNPGGLTVARFDVGYSGADVAYLKLLEIRLGYEIVRVSPCEYGRPGGAGSGSIRERDASSTVGLGPIGVAPNPFSEQLELYMPLTTLNPIHVGLFNLSGQKVLDQQLTGGQAQYTLNTVALAPGFYMLRIEADGEVQTLKVVKSE